MSIPGDPAAARGLESLSAVQRQLGDAVARLLDSAGRAAGLAAQTDWRTDAATRFHASAQAWGRDVAALADDVDGARGEVGLVRARIAAEAGGWGM